MYERIKKECLLKEEYYNLLSKENLQVDLNFLSPIAYIDDIALDGILSYFSISNIISDLGLCPQSCLPFPDGIQIDIPLPFEKRGTEKKYWSCSFGIPEKQRTSITKWRKRWDEENDHMVDFGKKAKRVDHKSSHFKAYDMPLVLQDVEKLSFYCFANKEELKRLVQQIQFVGKKRTQGFGRIKNYNIFPIKNDWSEKKEGKYTRAIPFQKGNLEKGMYGTFKKCGYYPPYWFYVDWCYVKE
jgi:CRISPR type IV-associated protein Csf3